MKIAGSRRMLIIGNGPSTAEVAGKMGRLPPDVDTFGMGAAYRYFRRVNWWPTYYALADQKVAYSHRNALAEIVADPTIQTERFFFAYPLSSDPRCELIPHGSTGDFCYRKAIALGYTKIYLIGVEGNYVEEIVESRPLTRGEAQRLGYASLRKRKNLRIITTTPKSNPNYFFDDYQQEGDVYSLPEAAGHRDRWAASARLALYHDVSTWNLSPISALRFFAKKDSSILFHEKKTIPSRCPYVVVLNPTLRTDVERAFWQNFCRELLDRGYLPVIFAARAPSNVNIPPLAEATYFTEMVWHLEEAYRSPELSLLYDNFHQKHASVAESISDFATQKHSKLDAHVTSTGLKKLSCYMEYILTRLEPHAVVVNNDTNIPAYLFSSLARELCIPLMYSERSPSTNQWFEPNGFYALSALSTTCIADATERAEFTDSGSDVIEQLICDPTAHRGLEADPSFKEPARTNKAFVGSARPNRILLALDEIVSTGWSPEGHPLKELNYPLFESPQEAIAKLAAIAADVDAVLILKPHPNQVRKNVFSQATLPDNVELYTGDLKPALELSDVIICFLTKVAFSALALGKPVVTLAPNVAALSGLTFHCTEESQIPKTIRAAFDYEWCGSTRAKLAAFLGFLESEYFLDRDLSNNGAKRVLKKYFPKHPLPDPATVEESKAFLSSVDHLNSAQTVVFSATEGRVQPKLSRSAHLASLALKVLRRHSQAWVGLVIVTMVLAIAPTLPSLWSYRALFWISGGLLAIGSVCALAAALAGEVFRKLLSSREAALAGFPIEWDVVNLHRALATRDLSESKKTVVVIAFRIIQSISWIYRFTRAHALGVIFFFATLAALAFALVAYAPLRPNHLFWGLAAVVLMVGLGVALVSLTWNLLRETVRQDLRETIAQTKGVTVRLDIAVRNLSAVLSRLARLEQSRSKLESRVKSLEVLVAQMERRKASDNDERDQNSGAQERLYQDAP